MKARILVVDDEKDLESLILQKFRRQIRDPRRCLLMSFEASHLRRVPI
jgi:hypothetical protein